MQADGIVSYGWGSGRTAREGVPVVDARANNFDLIRLVAALQVVMIHGVEHFGSAMPLAVVDVVNRFPGVPIFFVISGFLISKSFERQATLGSYARNRVLRIYPALYFCLAFSIATVMATGYFWQSPWSFASLTSWLLAQLTILQFYRAPFLDGYATGTLNGSLWTIPVEMQFYAIIPLLYWALRRSRQSNWWLLALIALFIVPNVYRYGTLDASNTTFAKLFKMSFVPYIYVFLLGVLCQRNFGRVVGVLRGRAGWWLLGYALVSAATSLAGLRATENGIHPVAVIPLAGLTLSAAFSAPWLGQRLLQQNDLSYGIYIFHMPIANVLIFSGAFGRGLNTLVLLAGTLAMAAVSWWFVEAPALRLKKHAMRPVPESVVA